MHLYSNGNITTVMKGKAFLKNYGLDIPTFLALFSEPEFYLCDRSRF